MKLLTSLLLLGALWAPSTAHGAIGCTLSNPAADLKSLYPEMTSYKEDLLEFSRFKDGTALFAGLRARLGADLDPIYESFETPYTVYTAFKGQTRIGIVHGVNVPGKGGVIQVFLATDPRSAAIQHFFFQRLESPAARALRAKAFRDQFVGLTLADFYKHDFYANAKSGPVPGKIAALRPPDLPGAALPDYAASLRGVKKNLILLDFFVYARRFEPFFQRSQAAKAQVQ